MPPRFSKGTTPRRGWVALLAGLVGLGSAAGASAPAAADPADYRPATAAPAAWLAFAEIARSTLAERLAADDAATEPLRRRIGDKALQTELIVQVWVAPNGTAERVVVVGTDPATAALVRGLLETVALGAAPPPDMAQPLKLKLTLAAKGGAG